MIQSSLCSTPSTLGINQFESVNLNKILFKKQTIVCVCIYDLWCECMNVYKGLCEMWHVCMVEDLSHDMMTVVGESSCPCALEQDVKQQVAPEAVFWCVNVSPWASERASEWQTERFNFIDKLHSQVFLLLLKNWGSFDLSKTVSVGVFSWVCS